MSRHSQGPSPISNRLSKEPSSSSLWSAVAPIPDQFPPSQRHLDQHVGYEKRAVSGISTVAGTRSEDAQKRRRLLLEMDDWTGARAQKPLKIAFPRADPDAPAWGWSGETETDATAAGSQLGSASYSVKRYSPARYSFPSSSSTATAMTSRIAQSRYPPWRSPGSAVNVPVEARGNSQNSQPVSGTLSAEERQRFDSDGVGILSPSGLTTGSASQGSPIPRSVHVPEVQSDGSQESSDREESRGSSTDRERTPSDVLEDVIIGEDGDFEGHWENEAKGLEETCERSDADESEPEELADSDEESQSVEESPERDLEADLEERDSGGAPSEDDSDEESIVSAQELTMESRQELLEECDDQVQLVPVDGPLETQETQQTHQTRQEHQEHQHQAHQGQRPTTYHRRTPQSSKPPKLVCDTSTLSEVGRAAAIEAQRVTIREIPNYNDSDDPIEDSESESEMMRRAKPLQKGTRGRGAGRGRGRAQRTARRGRG